MSVCSICGAEYHVDQYHPDQVGLSYHPNGPRITEHRSDYCLDCNQAAERHAQADRAEREADQRSRREQAFPKAFLRPFGRS
jgi:hypothetical protein